MMTAISLPRQTAGALQAIPLPDPVPSLAEIQRAPEALAVYAPRENGLAVLRLFLEWIPPLREQYRALGIPDSVFRDNLKDLTLWTEDYVAKHQAPGFAEWEWVANTFLLKVFRLGRLQFEPSVLEEAVLEYPAGTPVLEVHIPAGEPLEEAAVMEALNKAPAFFRTHFHREFSLFRCHSWLLCPQLKTLLPESSRILRFQNLFTVYGEDTERQAEERVFGCLTPDAARYPEQTSLQKTMKQALLEGKTFGMGMGIRKIP